MLWLTDDGSGPSAIPPDASERPIDDEEGSPICEVRKGLSGVIYVGNLCSISLIMRFVHEVSFDNPNPLSHPAGARPPSAAMAESSVSRLRRPRQASGVGLGGAGQPYLARCPRPRGKSEHVILFFFNQCTTSGYFLQR